MDTQAALLDEITGGEVQPPAPDPVPEPQTPPEPAPSPEPQAPEAPAEPAPQPEDGRHVPLATFLDARDRAKEAERRLAEMEAKAPKPEPAQAPDPVDDPEGYRTFVRNEARQEAIQSRFEMSDVLAKQTHGAETVEAASTWAMEKAKADPAFAQQYMREQHPIDWIVRQHKRDAMLSGIGEVSTLDELVAREAARLGYVKQSADPVAAPAVVMQPAVVPAAPPRSIASDPPAARQTDGSADFMDIFRK